MKHWLFPLLVLLVSSSAFANRYSRWVVENEGKRVVFDGECTLIKLKLIDADGKPTELVREKKLIPTSSVPSTSFYQNYDPPCTEAVRMEPNTGLRPNQSELKFHFKDDLRLSETPNFPHEFVITLTAYGTETLKIPVQVRTRDCARNCRSSCLANQARCAKACTDVEKRKCKLDCYAKETECVGFCQDQDTEYKEDSCSKARLEYCDVSHSNCYGRCLYNADARNTLLGAKCMDSCWVERVKCWKAEGSCS